MLVTTPVPTDLLHVDLDERPWAAYASCRDADPEMFFSASEAVTADAVRICGGCPVKGECLSWAIATRVKYGIWGGLDERQRRRLVRRSA